MERVLTVQSELPRASQFLLCWFPDNLDHYGPWKQNSFELGGLNSMLAIEKTHSIPVFSRVPTIILSMESLKFEIIELLFKLVFDKVKENVMREALLDFYTNSRKMKPDQIIIFRNGVSEPQSDQILSEERGQVVKAWQYREFEDTSETSSIHDRVTTS
ncbi:hypothetical protein GOBAR_AA15946 [Gossypium barbadense]|uniref:Piwi domain-containing protein n=1 Tax=Gossypium barbadense TaxID=3634 RepID=A0A2P5XN32_GOSBA|nr:hypothetical protein GOBAR_AA15946 [Gossypium barbadense]